MKRKRIVVMGFMGSIPIAGVIWQHIHYIVGLQRLGHDVYYIEDSARLPYNPQTFDTSNDYSYAAKILGQLANEFGFERRWGFCARYLPGKTDRGPPPDGRSSSSTARPTPSSTSAARRNSTTTCCGAIASSTSRAIPGVEQIKVDKGIRSTVEYLGKHRALFHLWRKHWEQTVSGAPAQIEMAPDPAAGRDRSLEDESHAGEGRRFHLDRKLVHQRLERHRVARRKISLEQVARISSFRCRAEKIRRTIRARDRHQGREDAREIPARMAGAFAAPTK